MSKGYMLTTAAGGGEFSNLFRCIPFRTDAALPVILLHGSGAPYGYAEHARVHSARWGPYVCRNGHNAIAGTMGYQTWANDTAMTAITNSINYIKTQFGLPPGPVHLVGSSMGGALGLRYSILNPSQVASYTGLIPLTDLVSFYNGHAPGASKDEISTAWGVASGAPLPPEADIASLASSINGVVPSRLYYANDDTIVLPTWVTTVGASMGAELVDVGALGHSEAAIGAPLDLAAPDDPESFFKQAEA